MANNTFSFGPISSIPKLVQIGPVINNTELPQNKTENTNTFVTVSSSSGVPVQIHTEPDQFYSDISTESSIYSDYGNQARDLGLKFEIDHETGHSLLIYKELGIVYLALVSRSGKILSKVRLDEQLPDHEGLTNKYLIINQQGGLEWKTDSHFEVLFNTTHYWDSHPDIRTTPGTLYVYIDKFSYRDSQGNTIMVPGIKIGDGNAYLIDKPFITDAIQSQLNAHLADYLMHLRPGEREKWNNKLNYIDPETTIYPDLLEFTRD